MKGLRLTRKRIVTAVTALVGALTWIAAVQIPADRLQLTAYALQRLWPEIAAIVLAVYVFTVRNWIIAKWRSASSYAKNLNLETRGLVRNTCIASLAGAACLIAWRGPYVYEQSAQSFERRFGMYRHVFSGNYVDHLYALALERLSASDPSGAANYLGTAASWPLSGSSERQRYETFQRMAVSRDLLAGELFDVYQEHQEPWTNITGSAYLGGAIALDRSTLRYTQHAEARIAKLQHLRKHLAPIFATCGNGMTSDRLDVKVRSACVRLVTQHIGVGAKSCSEAARNYCATYGVGSDGKVSKERFHEFFDTSSGLADLRAIASPQPLGVENDFYDILDGDELLRAQNVIETLE